MTEQEWLQANDPMPMLLYLRGKTSDRKPRLFTCACCRQLDPALSDETVRHAVEVTERWVDGNVCQEEVGVACRAAAAVVDEPFPGRSRRLMKEEYKREWLLRMARWVSDSVRPGAAIRSAIRSALVSGGGWQGEGVAEEGWQNSLTCFLRDIFGPMPFRPITLDPSWLTWHDGLLVSMARQMYDSRDFTDMPVLADALEEAGCTNQDILGHCRTGVEHVRGCWIVDLVLGKK